MHQHHQHGVGFGTGIAQVPQPPPFDYKPALREAINAGEVKANATHFFVMQENAYVSAPLLLGEIKHDKLPATTYKAPRVPYSVFLEALQFNLDGFAKIKSEVQITGYLNPTTGHWFLWPFKQTGQGLHTQETDCPENTAKRLELLALGYDTQGWCFTMHNHCTATSFQSGTDTTDENNRPGIHITVGQLDKPSTDIHVRAVASFNAMITESGKVIHAPRTLQWTPMWTDIIDFGEHANFADKLDNATLTKILCSKNTGKVTPAEWLDCVSERPRPVHHVWTSPASTVTFPNGVRSSTQYLATQTPTKAYSVSSLVNQYMDSLIPVDPDITEISRSLATIANGAQCSIEMPLKGLSEMMSRAYIGNVLPSDYTATVSKEKKLTRWISRYPQMSGVSKIIESWGASIPEDDTEFPFLWSPNIAAALSFFYATFTFRACWSKTARKTADKSVRALWANKGKPLLTEARLLEYARDDWWLRLALSLLDKHVTEKNYELEFTTEKAVSLLYKALCSIAVSPSAYATFESMCDCFALLLDPPTTVDKESAIGMALTYGPSLVGLVARCLDSNLTLTVSSDAMQNGLSPMGNMSADPKFSHNLQRWLPTSNKATVCGSLLAALHSQADEFTSIMSPLRIVMEPHLSDQDFAILENQLADVRKRLEPEEEKWGTAANNDLTHDDRHALGEV